MKSSELCDMFLSELKKYNSSNFKSLESADICIENASVLKSCSSVITRFFIFFEKHPEISQNEMKMLYYKLSIDRIARYFSEYPSCNSDDLQPFQMELRRFAKVRRDETDE